MCHVMFLITASTKHCYWKTICNPKCVPCNFWTNFDWCWCMITHRVGLPRLRVEKSAYMKHYGLLLKGGQYFLGAWLFCAWLDLKRCVTAKLAFSEFRIKWLLSYRRTLYNILSSLFLRIFANQMYTYTHVCTINTLCGRCDTGAKQDAWHIFTQCPAFATLRQQIFKDHKPEDLTHITDHQLGSFISESNYCWFPHDEEPEDPG